MHYLGCKFKIYRTVFVHFPGKLFIITVVLVSALNPDCEQVQIDQFCEDKHDFLELTASERCSYHHNGLECKRRKSRDVRNSRQVWPWNTRWNGTKFNWILPRECTGHTEDPLSITQDMAIHMDITKWFLMESSCLYNQEGKVYNTVGVEGIWSSLWIRPTAIYGTIQKVRCITTRPARDY